MLQLDATWMDNISNRIWPTPLLVIKAAGNRVYSNRDVSDITASVFGPAEDPVISFENRVITFGQITKKVFDFTQTIVQGFNKKTLQIATVVLNNSDYEISVLIDRERWHNRSLQIYLAYADSTAKLKIFEGVIQDIAYSLDRGTVTLKATETGYDQIYRPNTINNLSTALGTDLGIVNPEASLPLVYGQVDNTALPGGGAWEAPAVAKSAAPTGMIFVYAGHEVLSTVAGNEISVWADKEKISTWIFRSSDTRFNIKPIATVDIRSTLADVDARNINQLTVRGSGKVSSVASTVLIENLIDIMDDFITVENSSVFTFDPTNKIDAQAFLDSTHFTAAPPAEFSGVVAGPISVWAQIQEMLSGLGGSAFISSDDGELKVVVNEFIKIPDNSLIVSRGDILDIKAVSRVKNVYNSIKHRHAWLPSSNQFGFTNVTVTNSSSINIYGTRELILDTKWSFTGQDAAFLKSELRFTASRPLDIIICTIANPVIMQIEPGLDYLYLTFENLIGTDGEMKINEFCKVLSIKFLLDQNKAELTVMDTNQWKDDGAGSRDMTLY